MKILTICVLAAAAACVSNTAEAAYPTWCANTADRGDLECRFYNWEQCQAFLSGLNGYCIPNPYLGWYATEPEPRYPRRRYR